MECGWTGATSDDNGSICSGLKTSILFIRIRFGSTVGAGACDIHSCRCSILTQLQHHGSGDGCGSSRFRFICRKLSRSYLHYQSCYHAGKLAHAPPVIDSYGIIQMCEEFLTWLGFLYSWRCCSVRRQWDYHSLFHQCSLQANSFGLGLTASRWRTLTLIGIKLDKALIDNNSMCSNENIRITLRVDFS